MSRLVRPFAGLRPAPGRAAEVVAPPYDVLSSAEARTRAQGRPCSFLHVSKAEIDLPEGTDPYAGAVYLKARENFDRLCAEGVLRDDPAPSWYVYRLTMAGRTQTGVVLQASVAAYRAGRIRRHELTRPDKEDDRVRQIEALDAQTGPVFLAYRARPSLDARIDEVTQGEPAADVTADDGVRHTLWVVEDPVRVEVFQRGFDAIDTLYIADGHHRSAAAARVSEERHARGFPPGAQDGFLAVAFPHDQLRILDYNRVVKDLNGLGKEDFLSAVAKAFDVAPSDAPVKPERRGEYGLYVGGAWYRLTLPTGFTPPADPVAALDVSVLQERLLAPVLGIGDPRRDARIDFVGGIRGLGELERRVDSGSAAVAFALHPTSMEELMAVADADRLMPPKSTWFEPKLADGLVSHRIGG